MMRKQVRFPLKPRLAVAAVLGCFQLTGCGGGVLDFPASSASSVASVGASSVVASSSKAASSKASSVAPSSAAQSLSSQ